MIDLRVECGGVYVLMSKDLRNLGQRRASTKHLRRCSVAKTMGAPVHDARTAEGALCDGLDPRDRHRGVWRATSYEHGARSLVSRRDFQVARNRMPDIGWERQAPARTALATDRELPHLPVDLLELDGRYLTSPQTQSNHQQQRRVVSESHERTAIACREDRSDLEWLETLGQ